MINWVKLAEAARVKRARDRIGVRDAAKQIGVSPSTVSRFENEKELSADHFMAVCKWLGISAEEALT
jgi:transcriptional regulator with XRE-family HTH domain